MNVMASKKLSFGFSGKCNHKLTLCNGNETIKIGKYSNVGIAIEDVYKTAEMFGLTVCVEVEKVSTIILESKGEKTMFFYLKH
jgi:hypothetical protein